jgi:hypothetical protein
MAKPCDVARLLELPPFPFVRGGMETLEEMRRRAEEAERRAAEAAHGEERETFLLIAKNWRRLIELVENRWGVPRSR